MSKTVLLQCWIKFYNENTYDVNQETIHASSFSEHCTKIQQGEEKESKDEDVAVEVEFEYNVACF